MGPRALAVARGILWSGRRVHPGQRRAPSRASPASGPAPTPGRRRFPPSPLSAAEPGHVTLRWKASWDRDDAALTYRLYRDGRLVSRQERSSTYWNRPWMSYTDLRGRRHPPPVPDRGHGRREHLAEVPAVAGGRARGTTAWTAGESAK
ncbi:hypothetical protein LT493_12385 [Streptomyces tricolor]|nr:hypothetical protein [Streptomyces tricolor]